MLRTKRTVLAMTVALLLSFAGAAYALDAQDRPAEEPSDSEELDIGFGSGAGFGSGGGVGSASGMDGFGGSASNGGSAWMSYGFGSGFTTGMPGSTGSGPLSNPTGY